MAYKSKSVLIEEFIAKFGKEPAAEMQREEIESALNATEKGIGLPDPNDSTFVPDPGSTPGPKDFSLIPDQGPFAIAEEVIPGEMDFVKLDDDGSIIDRTKMNKAAFDLLPEHKFGWKLAPPEELAGE